MSETLTPREHEHLQLCTLCEELWPLYQFKMEAEGTAQQAVSTWLNLKESEREALLVPLRRLKRSYIRATTQRARSAFNFYQLRHPALVEAHLPLGQRQSAWSQLWTKLSDEQKAPYVEQSREEKALRHQARQLLRKRWKNWNPKASSPPAAKKKRNAFLRFVDELAAEDRRQASLEQRSITPHAALLRQAGPLWRGLPDETKRVYYQQYQTDVALKS